VRLDLFSELPPLLISLRIISPVSMLYLQVNFKKKFLQTDLSLSAKMVYTSYISTPHFYLTLISTT